MSCCLVLLSASNTFLQLLLDLPYKYTLMIFCMLSKCLVNLLVETELGLLTKYKGFQSLLGFGLLIATWTLILLV